MIEKRGLDAMLNDDALSVSSPESEIDSEHELGDKTKATSSTDTRARKKHQKAELEFEPDDELRKDIEYLVSRVAQRKAKVDEKQGSVNEMKNITGGKSFEELDRIKTNYSRNIRSFNRKTKKGFNAFELVGMGICPGCDDCLGTNPIEEPGHDIDSINSTNEATMIGVFQEGVNALSQRLVAMEALQNGKGKEKEKEKGKGKEKAGSVGSVGSASEKEKEKGKGEGEGEREGK